MSGAVKILNEIERIIVPEVFDVKSTIGTFGKNGLTLVTALSSAFAANATSMNKWTQEQIITHPRSQSRLFVSSDWSGIWEDAKDIKFISSCFSKTLDINWLTLSLNEHKGGMLSKTQFDDFKETMSGFTGMKFLECYVAYRKNNDLIRSTIKLDNDFFLIVTYFVDENDGEVAFSLDYNEETVITGHGKSSDIAHAVAEIINTVKVSHG